MKHFENLSDALVSAARTGAICSLPTDQQPADYESAEGVQDSYLRALGLKGGHCTAFLGTDPLDEHDLVG